MHGRPAEREHRPEHRRARQAGRWAPARLRASRWGPMPEEDQRHGDDDEPTHAHQQHAVLDESTAAVATQLDAEHEDDVKPTTNSSAPSTTRPRAASQRLSVRPVT